jgi:sialate O-acetylesterase
VTAFRPAILLLFVLAAPCVALQPAPWFTDHAVLPANRSFPVWGRAAAGETVWVSFAGHTGDNRTAADGAWQVMLPVMSAGTRGTLEIRTAAQTLDFQDVVTGEIWFCSGQSNMQWTVGKSLNASHEIATADFSDIRHFFVPLRASADPCDLFQIGQTSWQPATSAHVGQFTAVGYFFARHLHRELKVPVGLIHASWGGTPIHPWMTPESIQGWDGYGKLIEGKQREIAEWPVKKAQYDEKIRQWETEVEAARAEGREPPRKPWVPGPPDAGQYMPSRLYQAMVHPFIRMPVHGVLWYQGESNAGGGEGGAQRYAELQRRLVTGWRKAWNCGDFPFYHVQLANFRAEDPSGISWAFLREAQQAALDVPATAMATAVDIGDSTDVHPTNKQEVGRRLALLALRHHYGKKDIICHGPQADAVEATTGGELRIRFKHAGGLTTRDGLPPAGFEVAGDDMAFRPATARIDGGSIVVSHPDVTVPRHVRHAFTNDPTVNLTNRAGLPALPCRLGAAK